MASVRIVASKTQPFLKLLSKGIKHKPRGCVSVYFYSARRSRSDVQLLRRYSTGAGGSSGAFGKWLKRKVYVVLVVAGVSGGAFLYVSWCALIRVNRRRVMHKSPPCTCREGRQVYPPVTANLFNRQKLAVII